ncbi:MAG: GIY-YIG nuclease family protein [Patescibacteria group bacterium]
MFHTYILQSEESAKYYIGSTGDLEKRINRHNAGRNKSTKSQRPWRLVYKEFFTTKQDAYRREMEIKSYKGGNAFKKLI